MIYFYIDDCGLTEYGPFDSVPEALDAAEGYAHHYTIKVVQLLKVSHVETQTVVTWRDQK